MLHVFDEASAADSIAFLSSSYVQNLADRHGRRPLLIGLPILATIATSAMIVACQYSLLSRSMIKY